MYKMYIMVVFKSGTESVFCSTLDVENHAEATETMEELRDKIKTFFTQKNQGVDPTELVANLFGGFGSGCFTFDLHEIVAIDFDFRPMTWKERWANRKRG